MNKQNLTTRCRIWLIGADAEKRIFDTATLSRISDGNAYVLRLTDFQRTNYALPEMFEKDGVSHLRNDHD